MADLQKRKQQLESEIDQKTQRLLSEQSVRLHDQAELAAIELVEIQNFIIDSRKELSATEESIQLTRNQRDDLEDSRNTLQNELNRLTISCENLQNSLNFLKKDVYKQEYALKIASETVIELIEQQDSLENSISGLEGIKGSLTKNIEALEIQLADLEHKKLIVEDEIDSKISIKKQQLDEFIQYEKVTRQQLTDRQLAIDERETIVTVRERKVDMAEQIIQQNAGLLEL